MTHPEVDRVMLAKVGDTDLTALDVYMIGQKFLDSITCVTILGHASPGSSLDYTSHSGVMWADVVRDYIAWTSGRKDLAPGCGDRLRNFVWDSGWTRDHMERAAEVLTMVVPA